MSSCERGKINQSPNPLASWCHSLYKFFNLHMYVLCTYTRVVNLSVTLSNVGCLPSSLHETSKKLYQLRQADCLPFGPDKSHTRNSVPATVLFPDPGDIGDLDQRFRSCIYVSARNAAAYVMRKGYQQPVRLTLCVIG